MWPQPGVVSFTTESDATDSNFPSGDPHAGPLGSADSEGLWPHAPTLEKVSHTNFFRSKIKRHPNQKPNSNYPLESPKPTAATAILTEVWSPLFSRMVSEA